MNNEDYLVGLRQVGAVDEYDLLRRHMDLLSRLCDLELTVARAGDTVNTMASRCEEGSIQKLQVLALGATEAMIQTQNSLYKIINDQ